jgi:hypothetical protein
MADLESQNVRMAKISGTFPDFFIVGAPKCGTTSLHSWIARHPELHMPAKEPGFFSQDILPLGKTLEGYLELFSGAKAGQLIGESTPKYLYSSLGLRHLQRLNPDARIIVTLRPPVDLVLSFHGQMLREGEEDERSFRRAWTLVDERLNGRSIPSTCRSAKLLDYRAWGCIGDRLLDIYELFPARQVMVVLLEEMNESPREVYAKVLAHLGVQNDGFDAFTRWNEGRHVRQLWLHHAALRVRSVFQPLLEVVQAKRGGRGTGAMKILNRINQDTMSGVQALDPGFRSELLKYFEQQVMTVERLIQRDLSHWKQ